MGRIDNMYPLQLGGRLHLITTKNLERMATRWNKTDIDADGLRALLHRHAFLVYNMMADSTDYDDGKRRRASPMTKIISHVTVPHPCGLALYSFWHINLVIEWGELLIVC